MSATQVSIWFLTWWGPSAYAAGYRLTYSLPPALLFSSILMISLLNLFYNNYVLLAPAKLAAPLLWILILDSVPGSLNAYLISAHFFDSQCYQLVDRHTRSYSYSPRGTRSHSQSATPRPPFSHHHPHPVPPLMIPQHNSRLLTQWFTAIPFPRIPPHFHSHSFAFTTSHPADFHSILLSLTQLQPPTHTSQLSHPHSVHDQDISRFGVWGEPRAWFTDGVFLLCPHVVEGQGALCELL